MTEVFSPQGGLLGTLRQTLGDLLVKSGASWTEKPDAPIKLSRSFLAFYNQMSSISDALFAAPGAKPSMHYKLLVRPNPGVKLVKGTLDGEPFSMTEKQYNWPSSSPGVTLRLEQTGGGDQPMRGYSGPWAIFQLLSGSDRHVSGTNQFGLVNVQAGRRSLPQSILPDGTQIVVEVVEFPNGVQRAFDSDFFRVSCPVKATED
jgi:type VI protein secretion system component VasK